MFAFRYLAVAALKLFFLNMKLFESPLYRRAEDIYCTAGNNPFAQVKYVSNSVSSTLEVQDNTTDTFPFQHLPVICKLEVFSYLKTHEKGISATVCKEWNALLNFPSLWKIVDLGFLRGNFHLQNEHSDSPETSSASLKKKLLSFTSFMENLGAKIKNLTFDLEICFEVDAIDSLLESHISSELNSVTITWNNLIPATFRELQETPKPDFDYNRRRQQRQKVVFLKKFVELVPKIESLTTPFDWSMGATSAITMLTSLRKLVLLKHSELQSPHQSNFDAILNSLTNLESLEVEVCTPSLSGLQDFGLKSSSLKHLKISRSKGICFSCLKFPKLTHLEVSMEFYTCPLNVKITQESARKPCLYSLLRSGAPALKSINNHLLSKMWQHCRYAELESVLVDACPCPAHCKTSNQP